MVYLFLKVNALKIACLTFSLSIPEILKCLRLLECVSETKQYYNESEFKTVSFEQLFINLITLVDLQNEIKRCIISEDEVADEASVELRNIRRQIKVLQGRVKEKLNEMISSSSYKNMLQEPVVTFKQNRYCLPVKVEYKSQLKGIIHEESASGQTVFVEPIQVIEINNKIKEFEEKEKDEIERILFRLSYDLKENFEVIENDYNILILLDFIFAKGKFSKELDGCEPKFNTNGYINLKLARHPLIDKGISYTVPCRGCRDVGTDAVLVGRPFLHAGKDAMLARCPFLDAGRDYTDHCEPFLR